MSKIVGRTLDFLELFAEQKRPLSLSEISRLLKIPVSSCHDVLQALQERGYIYELAPRVGYYPTLRLSEIGRLIADNDPVVLRADILLRELRDVMDESVLLAKVNGLQAIYLMGLEPTHSLRFSIKVGAGLNSLHATSAGKALLGSLDPAKLDRTIAEIVLTPFTERTLTSPRSLREEIERGRARGWFLNNEESLEGLTTLSASFAWNSSLYIVTIAGLSSRIAPRLDNAAALLIDVCQRLEMRGAGS